MFSTENLKRYPFLKNDPLQAWNSADELLISHLRGQSIENKKILVINDEFGALAANLLDHTVDSYSDSFLSYIGTKGNTKDRIVPFRNLNQLAGPYDFVLIQLPKNTSYFEDVLAHLTQHLHPTSEIICGGMIKHMAKSHFDLINKYIGQTTTSLATKKARLIFATFEKEKVESPFPLTITFPDFEKAFINHSNLFSREKLDIGTRFLLEHMPIGEFSQILDLGCANGIVGIRAKQIHPAAQIHFSDESFMAIQSAETNYKSYFQDSAECHWTNCFEDGKTDSLDLVLCNPPFHQQNVVGDFVAWQMFTDAHRALKKGGLIRVIGNSHLGYQLKLKKIFGHSEIIATNNKFMIVDARK